MFEHIDEVMFTIEPVDVFGSLVAKGSGAGVTMGALLDVKSRFCSFWYFVIATFAACGMGLSFGLESDVPMWRYICSGSVRKR